MNKYLLMLFVFSLNCNSGEFSENGSYILGSSYKSYIYKKRNNNSYYSLGGTKIEVKNIHEIFEDDVGKIRSEKSGFISIKYDTSPNLWRSDGESFLSEKMINDFLYGTKQERRKYNLLFNVWVKNSIHSYGFDSRYVSTWTDEQREDGAKFLEEIHKKFVEFKSIKDINQSSKRRIYTYLKDLKQGIKEFRSIFEL